MTANRSARAQMFSIAVLSAAAVLFGAATIARLSGHQAAAPVPSAKIAVVDAQKVLTASTFGKTASARLATMQSEGARKIKLLQEELTRLEDYLSTHRISDPEDKVAALSKQFQDKTIEMRRVSDTTDQEVAAARDREMAAINAKVQPVIESIAKEMGVTAVFNKFESGLLYVTDAMDITDAVLKRLQ